MNIDITKHEAAYVAVLIEKRMTVIKNRILKPKKEEWYDYEASQIEMKICEISDEYSRLSDCINAFYRHQ